MTQITKSFHTDQLLLGVCYYPEHWNEQLWEEDLRRIAKMGFNVVRMGETAWNIMEPEEGEFDFSMFDQVIDICERYNLQVILGTPTYAPPAWLTEKYPQVLRVDFRGQTMAHGSRRHYNYTSSDYWRLCTRIVTEMLRHFKHRSSVIGWQIDNELNCHSDVSFAESDHNAFRKWCQNKYVSLDLLNEAWGTAFWAQTYSDWSQVLLPQPTVTYHSPSHLLDFYRFTSDSAIHFAEMQYEIIKRETPDQFATHNGIFGNIDYASFTERTTDFLSYDSYPSFQLMRKDIPIDEKDRLSGKHLSRIRGYSTKYLILEQQAGPGGQTGNGLNNDRDDYMQVSPKPGQIRLWTWQSIAHGADGVLYFRWRTCPYGAETLWHGLNDYGNHPNRRLREAAIIAEEANRISDLVIGTTVTCTAAVLFDYDNDSNCKIDRHTGSEYWRSEENIYLGLNLRHIGTDMLDLGIAQIKGNLDKYKIVFLPNAKLLEAEDTKELRSYIERGGTLVLGPRSGYKNRNNHAHMLPFPGVLRSLAGITVEDFTMITDPLLQKMRFKSFDEETTAPLFHEILKPEADDVQVLASYTTDYYAEEAAVTVRRLGKGRIVYFGTFFTIDNVTALLDELDLTDPFVEWAELPSEVETVYRTDGQGHHYAVLLNYADHPITSSFNRQVIDHLGNRTLEGTHIIEPYGIRWLEL